LFLLLKMKLVSVLVDVKFWSETFLSLCLPLWLVILNDLCTDESCRVKVRHERDGDLTSVINWINVR
jgi:hypothetical protein